MSLEGCAVIGGREICRRVVPAEDKIQAFIYHHLVPAKELLVSVRDGAVHRALRRLGGKAGDGAQLSPFGDRPVEIPVGGKVQVQLPPFAKSFMDQVRFELNAPPAGIAIRKVPSGQGGVAIELRSDAAKVEPGLKGNLIVDVLRQNSKQGNRRRAVLGTLPAIPYEVVVRVD